MEASDVIETIGSITKMENLYSIRQGILANTLVLQSQDPFPGYQTVFSQSGQTSKPISHYIILRYRYAPEKILKINKQLKISGFSVCYPSYGEIITRDAILPCIRLKGIENADLLQSVQLFYEKNDIELMFQRPIEGLARIKIFKTFRVREEAEDIFRDQNDAEKFYIKISSSLNWKRFDYVIRKIKTSLSNSNFDAALGIIYRFCGPVDVVRIYDQNTTKSRAEELRDLFVKEIKRDVLISSETSQN